MWVSNTGHGPGLHGRLGRLCTLQGTQVWGQIGTELLQSVWLTLKALFYQGRDGFWFGLVLIFFSGVMERCLSSWHWSSNWSTGFPQFAFHKGQGRLPQCHTWWVRKATLRSRQVWAGPEPDRFVHLGNESLSSLIPKALQGLWDAKLQLCSLPRAPEGWQACAPALGTRLGSEARAQDRCTALLLHTSILVFVCLM